ncbi:hypothetical protein K503DRAFT_786753 [Rhizopogon vinicolor AM-OR11-026]|uniref:Ankyrin n=1 Tax=Rhizopogon vinicolor AM-OR11-026 TaxID=1314800 RepID=A0A1B7MKG0_9AGAM|nr:hypothetical protein K503DRAFT_786753 [Rhizopogon vinicolor AM-OR11-026]
MATKMVLDSKSDTALPSYNAISTYIVSPSQRIRPSLFSRLLQRSDTRSTVLSRIRDLVTTPDYTPSSVAPIVDSCVDILSAADFSNLLQKRNIEGHTALYWAIVNNRREALSALTRFISVSDISSACSDDLRFACMTTSDQASFTQLNLRRDIGLTKYEPLRRSFGCPPDDVEVHVESEVDKRHFVASFRFKMFQKRLRIAHNVDAEFVAEGRIWWIRIYLGTNGKWYIRYGLSDGSIPATPHYSQLLVEAQRGTAQVKNVEATCSDTWLLVPSKAASTYKVAEGEKLSSTGLRFVLGNWLMEDVNAYLDSDGTLHAKLKTTLK